MTGYQPCTHDEAMALSKESYLERCKAWIAEFNNNNPIKVSHPSKCPFHVWVEHHHLYCAHDVVANTSHCEICGEPCCPDCGNHHVEQLSRVTGYVGNVSGFNEGKKQEFKDRQRFNIEAGGNTVFA